MTLALLFHYLMLNIFRMLIHPSAGACDLFVELFHGLYCSGSMCVGVTLWFGCGGEVSVCRLKHCFSLHTDTTPPQPKHMKKRIYWAAISQRLINIAVEGQLQNPKLSVVRSSSSWQQNLPFVFEIHAGNVSEKIHVVRNRV